MNLIDDIVKMCEHVVVTQGQEIIEGSCVPDQLEQLCKMVQDDPGTAFETGFNAGMSAMALLMGSKFNLVFSYDTLEWGCSTFAKEYIDQHFPNRHVLTVGDSKKTLKEGAPGTIAVALVDGGHDFETAYSDMSRLGRCSRKLMIDDTNDPEVFSAYERCVKEGLIEEVSRHSDTYITRREWIIARGSLGIKG